MFEDCFCHCAYEDMKHPTYDRNQPKIEPFKEKLAKMGCAADKCVVYDDLRRYIEEAATLGIDGVWVDNEHARPPRRKKC